MPEIAPSVPEPPPAPSRRRVRRYAFSAAKAAGFALLGALAAGIGFFIYLMEARPDLEVWHEVVLEEEFKASSPFNTFKQYLALEDRLFDELDRRVCEKVDAEDRTRVNRFNAGSLSDPKLGGQNWNRTFELTADSPRAGVLLLHGMSDSPYSLRALGQRFHAAGASVVGLRLPGHGTAPSGLVEATWKDMAAATALAAKHLHETTGGKPLTIVGYSNGGALAVNYALAALEDSDLPAPAALILISPAIGVSPAARFAVWQARLGHLLRLEKLAWNSIGQEYDPYKYGSFAVNAGDQVYRITARIQSRIAELKASGAMARFPPVLAFQSALDATVSTPALVKGLFMHLPENGSELVLFDIRRATAIDPLIRQNPEPEIAALMEERLGFGVALVGSKDETSDEIVARIKKAAGGGSSEEPLGMTWPAGVYSLSHIALPMPPSDPIYGSQPPEKTAQIYLGQMDFKGERGALYISAADMLRLRCNPFYPYLEKRALEFAKFESAPQP